MIDERRSLPSASNFERYSLCPASFRAERGFPDDPSQYAESGTRVHAALAGDEVDLTDAEWRTTEEAQRITVEVADALGFYWPQLPIREQRLWAEGHPHDWSAKPDLVLLNATRALIVEYKAGWGDVPPSTSNPQLMAQAVAVDENYGPFAEIVAVVVQPNKTTKATPAVFDTIAIAKARNVCTQIVTSLYRPDAEFRPGERQCQYCRAKPVCRAAHATVQTIATLDPHSKLEPLTGPELSALLDRCGAAEEIIGSIKAEAKRWLADGREVPGWKLKPGVEREKVVNLGKVHARASRLGVKTDDFAAACTITKAALKPLVRAATGANGAALDEAFDRLLDGCTESKTSAPQLVRG